MMAGEISFTELDIDNFYSARGSSINEALVIPALRKSISYDRLSGYFSVKSFVSVSSGLEYLFQNQGKMRLVIGIHDVPMELLESLAEGKYKTEELVNQYKEKFLNEAGFLTGEAEKNALAVMSWLLKLNLLEIRVAAPKNRRGIYHQKRMIFKDKVGNVICGSGSLNETVGGQANKEEMLFLFSWLVNPKMMELPLRSFEDIWSNSDPDIEIYNLDEVFATQVLERIGNIENPFGSSKKTAQALQILEISRNSSIYSPYNLSKAVLYPHQERVFKDALSRWPLRVLLADEVGLGKTLEAGVVLAYLLQFQKIRSVLILTPASLVRQWQDEMKSHFGIIFWRWDSGQSKYVDFDGNTHPATSLESNNRPELIIASAQWARLNSQSIVKVAEDLVVIDEAHSARVSQDSYGDRKSLMYKLAESLSAKVPHLMLLTATPMQVHPREYHGLLELLGMPAIWNKYSNYELGLEFSANPEMMLTLDTAATIGKLIKASSESYLWSPDTLTEKEIKLLAKISGADNGPEIATLIKQDLNLSRSLFIKQHPANLLTCRNTKSNLEKYDYKFPTRNFIAPEMNFPQELGHFMESLDRYLSNSYGNFELALRPHTPFPRAFARSTYYQRLASSLTAANSSLRRRLATFKKIESYLRGSPLESSSFMGEVDETLVEDELISDYGFESDFVSLLDEAKINRPIQVLSALQEEMLSMQEALENMIFLGDDIAGSDPKFLACIQMASKQLQEGKKVLVFSRYTDTLFSFVALYQERLISDKVGFAVYSGSEVWIQSNSGRRESTKTDVTRSLSSGEISIVFCSDAASEGLNLQSAQCLINLDVPWNPARLEQRIGRIARLGQKAEVVDIVNFWYPNSVEADMYARLLSRADIYQIAVGEFPDLFSESISEQLAIRLNSNLPVVKNAFEELQDAHRDIQRLALNRIWKNNDLSLPFSKTYRKGLIAFLKAADRTEAFSEEPGQIDSISIVDSVFDHAILGVSPVRQGGEKSLYCLKDAENGMVFYVRSLESYSYIHVHALGNLLGEYLGICNLDDIDTFGKYASIEELEDDYVHFVTSETSAPERNLAKTLGHIENKDLTYSTPVSKPVKFEHILIGKF